MGKNHWPWLLLALTSLCLAAAPTTKIVGGGNATESYPWMAGLHNYEPGDNMYDPEPFCGGSLIAPGWIVSAAHCFTSANNGGIPSSYSPQAEELIIRLNSPDLSELPEHFVSQLIAHPQYGVADGSDDSDIILIKLDSKVLFETISVADAPLMVQLENSTLLDDVVQIIGWGIYDDGDFNPNNAGGGNAPAYLQSVRLDYLPFSQKKCHKAWGGLSENMICAWEPQPSASSPFGQDSCFGDSGGPLMLPKNTQLSSFRSKHHWLLGITSFGSTSCNSASRPGIYTRLTNFESWLENTTQNSGDGLVDVSALLELPNTALPQQSFNFTAGLTNNSRLNPVSAAVVEVSAANTTLTPPSDHGCVAIVDGWRCTPASPMQPRQTSKLVFSASWLGADDQGMQVNVHAYDADRDDYRIANNRISATTHITLLPDPKLETAVISNQKGQASVRVTASNVSTINDVTGAQLIITLPAGLSAAPLSGCSALGAEQLSCPIGTLTADSSRSFDISLQGSGTFSVPLSLQTSNGDINPGDTSQTLSLKLQGFNPSSGAGWLFPLLLLYRRRNWRNQSIN